MPENQRGYLDSKEWRQGALLVGSLGLDLLDQLPVHLIKAVSMVCRRKK